MFPLHQHEIGVDTQGRSWLGTGISGMHIPFEVSDNENLVLDLFLDGYHFVEVEQVGTKVDIVPFEFLPFRIKQTAVDPDIHEQGGSVLAEPAVVGIPEPSPVWRNGIAFPMVPVGINPQGH